MAGIQGLLQWLKTISVGHQSATHNGMASMAMHSLLCAQYVQMGAFSLRFVADAETQDEGGIDRLPAQARIGL